MCGNYRLYGCSLHQRLRKAGHSLDLGSLVWEWFATSKVAGIVADLHILEHHLKLSARAVANVCRLFRRTRPLPQTRGRQLR